jgi:hypothetical protein
VASSKSNSGGFGSNAWIVAGVMMALIGTGVFLWARYASAAANKDPIALTPEAKAYVRNLKISEPEIKANESYMKLSLVEVTGKIKNAGDRPIDVVEIYCSFYDPYGQIVLRERVPIVKSKLGGLKVGEEKPFRLAFDTVPESWNQQMPGLVIAGIQFSSAQ